MSTLSIAILLVGVALILLGVDLFLPTGGILMILAAVAAITGMSFGFAHSATAGGWLTLVILLSIPTLLFFFVKYYPSTAIGKKMIIDRPEARPYDFSSGNANHTLTIGDVGLAKTSLQPAGKITIHGIDFEAVSITGIIDSGHAVVVTDIEMNVATVEKYDLPPDQPSTISSATSSLTSEAAEEIDLLNASIEQIDLQNFDTRKDG